MLTEPGSSTSVPLRPVESTFATPRSQQWIHGPLLDTVLGWCWLPIAVALHILEPHPTALRTLIGIIFLVSFAHQPLTLGLVYGDPAQMRAKRTLYRVAPAAAGVLVVVGMNFSLTTVALIAGLWNAEHTLMQRYGVLRIYGRKAGDANGSIEKPMLIAWLVTAISFLGGYVDLNRLVVKVNMGSTNANSVHLLDRVSGVAAVLFWPALLVSALLSARWIRAERRGVTLRSPGLAKHWYAAATFGLVLAVIVDPIAGVFGYIAAHSIEYFGIVHGSLRRRALTGDPSPVARATATAGRRAVVYSLYAAVIVAIIYFSVGALDGKAYAFAVLFFGALHILYDGFIWKLRRPSTAASLGIVAPT